MLTLTIYNFKLFNQNNTLIKSDELLRHSVVGCSLHVHIYLNCVMTELSTTPDFRFSEK